MKTLLQRLLRRLGLYTWLKEDSFVFGFYSYFKEGRPVRWREREYAFYRDLLGPQDYRLIFDIGANRGQRTALFLRLGARVIAVEPDETNQRVLSRKFSAAIQDGTLEIVGKAASDTARSETFWINSPGSGLNTLCAKWVETLDKNASKFGSRVPYPEKKTVETTTLAALADTHGTPHYIKIDVEGHELAVLQGMSRPSAFLSFEAILPEFGQETAACIELLVHGFPQGRFNFCGACYDGLTSSTWLTGPAVMARLSSLGEKTVEVFWRASPPVASEA